MMITAKELRQLQGMAKGLEYKRGFGEAADAIDALTRERDEALANARHLLSEWEGSILERDEALAAQRSDTGELWVDECERARKQRDEALRKLALYEPVVRWHAEHCGDRQTRERLAEFIKEAEKKP